MHISDQNQASALLVGLAVEEWPAELLDPLREHGCTLDAVGDVYRALARVGRREPVVVIVAVEWLFSAAFEFFSVMRRAHPNVAVLVAGPHRAAAKLNQAIELGASGVADERRLTQLLNDRLAASAEASPPARSDESGSSADESDAVPSAERIIPDTLASPGNVFDAELDRRLRAQLGDDEFEAEHPGGVAGSDEVTVEAQPERPELEEEGEEPSEQDELGKAPDEDEGLAEDRSTRVPWLQYASRPQRTPPRRTPPQRVAPAEPTFGGSERPAAPQQQQAMEQPSPAHASAVSASAEDDADDLPLLTPEELRALFGDDAEDGPDNTGKS